MTQPTKFTQIIAYPHFLWRLYKWIEPSSAVLTYIGIQEGRIALTMCNERNQMLCSAMMSSEEATQLRDNLTIMIERGQWVGGKPK